MPAISRADRLRGALWGLFAGDALAMPVHWYYDVAALDGDFGVVRDYQAPREPHPSSIMPLASTGKAGRGSQEGEVIGSVILHGKKHLWGTPGRHYHHGLRAGDNTLNLLCTRVLMRTLNASASRPAYDPSAWLAAYVAFMTTPGTHDDTYAESYHRDFFANFARGVPPAKCAGAEGHDTASVGGLVTLPLVLASAVADDVSPATRAAAVETALGHMRLTHRSAKLDRYAREYCGLFLALLCGNEGEVATHAADAAARLGFPARAIVERVTRLGRDDRAVIGGMVSTACYIDHSLPSVLYLATRHADDFEAALVANTNAGGDNCHRGAVLGALLGAALGVDAIPRRWITGLAAHDALADEIERFVARFAVTDRGAGAVSA